MSFVLREATLADIETLIYHRYSMWRDMGLDQHILETMKPAAREYFLAALPKGVYRGWLAEQNGKVLGGAGVLISAWPGTPGCPLASRVTILNVYVERDHRRRGIARSLMETMMAWCKSAGYAAVTLHASDDGRHLYESLGFVTTNEMRLNLT